jgi:hypothetical protein
MTRRSVLVARRSAGALVAVALAAVPALHAQGAARRSAAPYLVGDTVVRQGRFAAVALSRDTIVSTYPRAAREVRFRFSIDGQENEFPPGTEHTIYLRPTNGRLVTRLYTFGDEREPAPPTPEQSATSEEGTAQVTFRVDLRHVRRAIAERGEYRPNLGAPIGREGVKHVYVLGDPAPLSWDYAQLKPGTPAELFDRDGDGIWEGTVAIPTEYTRPRDARGRALWARSLDLSAFPTVTSSQRMQDALYRMSLEELRQLVREDGALSAGAKWPGVWTRDFSLASILSLAIVAPDAVRKSLVAKVDSAGRIIQDTGTGGSWPVSSDRMVWALAAWELYLSTGDRDWLRYAYDVTRRSAEADLHAVRDARTGLMNGESSFLDWREQSYPRWMEPADIYRSQNLGTNAVHLGAHRALAMMAKALGEPGADRWNAIADSIAAGMTRELWQPSRGWYGQYRYGRTALALSPRAEALGEALAVIYGAASRGQRDTLARRAPVVPFGVPVFWPYVAGERFYHNATIWPFVTAYATWAAADAGSAAAVRHGLDANARAAALFLTNKENMVAGTGHYEGTALNSDRQLWSVAGQLAATYRILLGMRLEPERLLFRPMVPPTYGGTRTVQGIRWRGATLTVVVRGSGDAVATARLDGRPLTRAELPASLTGEHAVELTMNGHWREASLNVVANRFAPATPRVTVRPLAEGAPAHIRTLDWPRVSGAVRYAVYRAGVPEATASDTTISVRVADGLVEWQVLAVDATGTESFLSEPVRLVPPGSEATGKPMGLPLEREHAGFTGAGYLRLTREERRPVGITVTIDRAGSYAVDVRYANGSGPVNTEDRVAVRTLGVDGDTAGVIVMPQRGTDRWSEWGWSNAVIVHLEPGRHTLSLAFTPFDENMNRRVNTALVDQIRLTRLATPATPASP